MGSLNACIEIREVWILLFTMGLLNTSWAQPETPDALPNIVYIFADDLGYGDLGAFGATDIQTPHIDRMAKEGIKFTDFYSASSVCSPSRAGLLTGRLPQRMGINQVFFPESFTGMPPEEITLAELLKQKGYVSGIVGKWHLGHHFPYLPLQQGFDTYFGIPYSNDMSTVVYMRDNEVVSFQVDQRYTTRTYTEEALQFLEANQDRPFFLYLSHNMPHVPLHASEAFEGSSQRGLYGDVVQELDWSVGEILRKLESLDLLENTLVIFSSDNGPWLVMEEFGGSAGGLREGKNYTFDGGMKVPTVALWKGSISPGTVSTDMATQMDWFPTLAALTGTDLPADRPIDGKDISQVLLGTGNREGQEFLFFDGSELQAFRKGKYKVKLPYEGSPGSSWRQGVAAHDSLLFDLEKDPGERHNLFSTQKALGRKLFAEMNQTYAALGELPPSLVVRTPPDNSHFEKLREKEKK